VRLLLVESEPDPRDPLADALKDAGHEVRTPAEAAPQPATLPWRCDVIVIRLERDAAAMLDQVTLLTSDRPFVGAPLLFTGGNELALTAARRRFPEANFVRLDNLATALASIEAGE
jgi:hypothetical protein